MTTIFRAVIHEGLTSFQYFCENTNCVLECWFEYEPAEDGYHETWSLHHAYLPESRIDIAPVLSQDTMDDIEAWVVREVDDLRLGDDEQLRYEDRRGEA